MNRNYPQFFTICRAFGLEKEELAAEASGGRTASLRGLTDQEWNDLMSQLQAMQKSNTNPADWKPKPGDVQRKKMISIARQMGWHLVPPSPNASFPPAPVFSETQIILHRLDAWTVKQKFKKPLMLLSLDELNILVTIFEEKVFKSYLKDLQK